MATSALVWKCPLGEPLFERARRLVDVTNGAESRPRTFVALSWTEAAFHVRFWCEDREPWATHAERDAPLYEEEALEVFVCPNGKLEQYFEFEVNPLGAVFDAVVHNPGLDRSALMTDPSWDCDGLQSEVLEWPNGWTASFDIPWESLGVSAQEGFEMPANFFRIERRPYEAFQAWSPTLVSPADFHRPLRFGRVVLVRS